MWSDKKIAELSREFVTVADEVYMLYPEDPGNLARVADRAEHKFFKKFGESMPAGDWNHPGTKQGIYMIGPDGEYLEGRFAAGSEPEDIRDRLARALERWQALRKEKNYANKPVPRVTSTVPPEVADKPWVLRINSRDLPRGDDDGCGARFDPSRHADSGFLGYFQWAWNENWLALDDLQVFVPKGKREETVDVVVVQRLVRFALVDNVRGQAVAWRPAAVRNVSLQMAATRVKSGVTTIEYAGAFELVDGERSFRGKIYGAAQYRRGTSKFESFDLLATGVRTGGQRFNQRSEDPGPAPLGIAIGLCIPPPAKRPTRASGR